MEQLRVVAENNEMRRLDADLRHIINLQAAALVRGRLDTRGRVLQNVVEHTGRNAHTVLVGDGVDRLKELVHALARQRRNEHDRRILHIAQVAPHILGHAVHGVCVLLDGVPLVDDDDTRLSGLVRKTRDLRVLLRHALVGVDQDKAHIRALDGGDGAHIAVALHGVVHLGLASHSRRIDEQVLAPFVLKIAVDGVAGRTGHVGDDHALLAENAVEQARLSDIRLADDGDLDDVLVVFLLVVLRECLNAGIQQVACAVAMDRGDLDRFAETKTVEFIGLRVDAAGLVALVDRQHDRLLRPLEHRGDLRVRRRQSDGHVHDHDDHVGRLNGDLRLTAHKLEHVVVGARLNAAGIDQQEAPAAPLAVAVDAVAGHAGRILDDGHAASGQFVEKHRLADIRPADDGYNGLCHNGLPSLIERNPPCGRGPPASAAFSGFGQAAKEKRKANASLSFSYRAKLLCRLDSDHFTAVVIAASLTSSVRQAGLAALRASDDTGDRQFPVGAASLISSCAGNFSLRYCHFRYTSLIEMPFRHIVYFFLSSSCCRTANLESGSLLQSQGPSLRFLPQRKQSPLQSSRHSSF